MQLLMAANILWLLLRLTACGGINQFKGYRKENLHLYIIVANVVFNNLLNYKDV